MASGIVSMGRLLQARAAGEALPAGWALDAEGRPTTDPAAAATPLPLGGAKGSGLALKMEMVASLLTLAPILAPSLAQSPGERRHSQNAFVIAIDIAQVAGVADYTALAGELQAAIHALPPAEAAEVLLPGERGARAAVRSAARGRRCAARRAGGGAQRGAGRRAGAGNAAVAGGPRRAARRDPSLVGRPAGARMSGRAAKSDRNTTPRRRAEVPR